MYLFKDNNNWVFGATIDSVCPAGCFRLEPSYDRESVSMRSVFDGKAFVFSKPVDEILKADGTGYADFDELKAATAGFFTSTEPCPQATTIPDEVDTTDGTVIYLGYKRGETYLVCQRTITATTVSTLWATGDWADREDLFTPE